MKKAIALAALAGSAAMSVALCAGPASVAGASSAAAQHHTGAPSHLALGPTAPTRNGDPVARPLSKAQLAHERVDAIKTNSRPTEVGRPNRATATATTNNWSGLATSGSFQGIAGQWVVPSVQATAANKYSCTWIGLDGFTNSSLIQTGTEEDSVGGHTRFYAWLETLPATQTPIVYTNGSLVPVGPGDSMWSYIYKTATANVWAIYLQDITRGWSLSTTVTYATPGANVEWIHEATTENGKLVPPPVFGTVTFTNLQVEESGTWYYTGLNSRSEVYMVQNGVRYATPGAPVGANPQQFSITYG